MKKTKILWDMPITVEILDKKAKDQDIAGIYSYFSYIDKTFSTFKKDSEITKINKGLIGKKDYSQDVKTVLNLCNKTQRQSNGYFSCYRKGILDPLGLVKGWAVLQASKKLLNRGFKNFFIDAGGDIQVSGKNIEGKKWRVGIRNPFNRDENIKILCLSNRAVATSGVYIRGEHIVNPLSPKQKLEDIVSLTVVAKDILEADRFATAAFAMGRQGIEFIEKQKGLEGYAIDKQKIATLTSGLNKYVLKDN
jgi:thiamine biosynthesis lipoprotein